MISERVPNHEWRRVPTPTAVRVGVAAASSAWMSGNLLAISSLTTAELPDGSGIGPQWQVSISVRGGKRPTDRECKRALRAFSMLGAEEDNHHPGRARQFWMPVDKTKRVDCECKTDERVVVEKDGYTWTNPHDQAACRGCALTRLTGDPCTIHAEARQ